MKQAHVIGLTKGLRPSQLRRLDALTHGRHPARNGADQDILEQLAKQVFALKRSLHMVLDNRGVCRLLFVGNLEQSGQLLMHLSIRSRRKVRDWRLVSCLVKCDSKEFHPGAQEAVVALDFIPISWLRFTPNQSVCSRWDAALWRPEALAESGWLLIEANELGVICNLTNSFVGFDESETTSLIEVKERIILLTSTSKDDKKDDRHLAELEGLVRSAGGNPVAIVRQKLQASNFQGIWGKGKLKETALEIRRCRASLVITDRELTPVQGRNLEKILDCSIMDRSELILDIFAQRASTSSGRLQVELAQLRYRMPRLIGRGKSLSRQGGGIGTRGPGETQLEKDRRAILRRVGRLRRDLGRLKQHRNLLRLRSRSIPRVAIVGYTNAGKSSLLNALCNLNFRKQVNTENQMFATLDPTTRRLIFPQAGAASRQVLITDTVGFIRELPVPLMEAFRATLEETLGADLLLLVADLSNPDWLVHLQIVNNLLDSLGAHSIRQLVANKIDCCDSSELDAIRSVDPKVLYVSATTGAGLKGLKLWLQEQLLGSTSGPAIKDH